MQSTCKCSEIEGLMPILQKTDDEEDPKYWMVHFMNNKKLNTRNKSKKSEPRTDNEITFQTGINKSMAKVEELNELRTELQAKYKRIIEEQESRLDKIFNDFKNKHPIDDKTVNTKANQLENIDQSTKKQGKEYYKYAAKEQIIDLQSSNNSNTYYTDKYKKLFGEYKDLKTKNTTAPIPSYMNGKMAGGNKDTQQLSDLFGKWSTNLRNKQQTGHTYYAPIEYLDTKTGKKFEIEDILIDPVHSRIKVEGIGKSIDFTEEKLREVVELYLSEMRKEEKKQNSSNQEEQLKNTLSFADYMSYKKTNDISNFNDHDEIVGTYNSLEEGSKMINNQTGGGEKFVNVNGEKVILKIGKNEQYITKSGNLISVKEYKNKNNYVELMTIDGEPMRIKSKNKEYYLSKDGKLMACKN